MVFFYIRTEIYPLKIRFTSWSKNPTANQMACIAFSTFEVNDTSNQVPRIMFFDV